MIPSQNLKLLTKAHESEKNWMKKRFKNRNNFFGAAV